ncbi:MAG: SoxR reducing system RseC family protein [Cellvibrionaceae bacterium]
MITESGRIVSIDSDSLWVETIQRSTCESCSAQKGCGQSMVAKWSGNTNLIRVLLNGRAAHEFKPQECVTIGIPERVVANGSLFVYMTPLIGMLVALLLGNGLDMGELGSMVLAAFGFGVGALVVRMHSARHKDNVEVQPVLLDDAAPVQWVEKY